MLDLANLLGLLEFEDTHYVLKMAHSKEWPEPPVEMIEIPIVRIVSIATIWIVPTVRVIATFIGRAEEQEGVQAVRLLRWRSVPAANRRHGAVDKPVGYGWFAGIGQ